MRLVAAALALPLLALPIVAQARPSHFDVTIKATKTGCTISCKARSDESSYKHAIVGLVPASRVGSLKDRAKASKTQAKVGVAAPTVNQAVDVTIHVPYGSEFKPGMKFHVVSAWSGGATTHGSSDHVWGAVMQTSASNEVTLPGTMTPAMKAAAAKGAALAKLEIKTLKGTQTAGTSALKAKQSTQLAALKARHASARDKIKTASAARRAKLDAKLAAATPRSPAAQAIRTQIRNETSTTQSKLSNLKYSQDRALDDLKWRHEDQRTDLKDKYTMALDKLTAKLGI